MNKDFKFAVLCTNDALEVVALERRKTLVGGLAEFEVRREEFRERPGDHVTLVLLNDPDKPLRPHSDWIASRINHLVLISTNDEWEV